MSERVKVALRRRNERMLTEVVFAIWPSLDGKPFRQRADKYSAAGFCSIQSQRGFSEECSFGGKVSGTGCKVKLGKTC